MLHLSTIRKRRRPRLRHDKSKEAVWRCVSRVKKKNSGINCQARTVREEELHEVVIRAVNEALVTRDTFLPILKENIARALNNNNGSAIAELDARLEELQKELIRKTDAHQNTEELSQAIDELRDEKQALLMEDANNKNLRDRIAELEAFLDAQETYVTEYSEQLVRTLIEKITVYDNYFTVEFKSGMETNVQI